MATMELRLSRFIEKQANMDLKIVSNKLAGNNTEFKQTPNVGKAFKTSCPDTIVIHYTAGASAESSVNTLINPSSKASAHLVVGRNEKIYQLADFNTITWHAGKSTHLNRSGINKYSIGIEIDNPGPLTLRNGKYYTWFDREVSEDLVVKAVHQNEQSARYWHRYTEQQIAIVEEICQLLMAQYPIKYIVGHEEISPGRKTDPGPAFPLDNFRNHLLENRSDEEENVGKSGEVTASFLNIRSGPGSSNPKVAQPLITGAKVKVLDEANGWLKVETSIEGWVSKNHIILK